MAQPQLEHEIQNRGTGLPNWGLQIYSSGINETSFTDSDSDGDAIPELPGKDTAKNVSQVLEKSKATPNSAYDKNLGQLLQNYPNPLTGKTRIDYSIANPVLVKLQVFDAYGILVDVLVNEKQIAGDYQVIWDPTQSIGIPLACGHFYYQLQIDGHVQTNSMIMIH